MILSSGSIALLLCFFLFWGGNAFSQPRYQEVSLSSGLNFIGTSFNPEDGLSPNQKIMVRNTGNGAAVGDIDGDGDLDIYLLGQLGYENRLFLNNLDSGEKTFTEATPELLADKGMSRVAAIVDLDNDGWRDILLINDDGYIYEDPELETQSKVFKNNGDMTFTDVSAAWESRGVGYLRTGLALADYDRDGLIDFFVSNWCMYGVFGPCQFPGSSALYRNEGNFVFKRAKLPGLDLTDSFSAILTDFNDDLFPDLFVAVDHRWDRFYRGGGGGFTDESEGVGVMHVGNDMGVACADFDNDDDLDLYTTNITDTTGFFGVSQGNAFYVNQFSTTGTIAFEDEATERGAENTLWGWGVEFVDVENDGDLDIVVATGFDEMVSSVVGGDSPIYDTPLVLLLNDGTGHFTRYSKSGLEKRADSRALIAFDYDFDGDQDILVTNIDGAVSLYENITFPRGHWLEVVLTPDAAAIGARVYVTTGTITRRRDVICGDSYLAGTPTEVHFGFGGVTTVDLLTIRWPDGSETSFSAVPVDRRMVVDFYDGVVPVRLVNLNVTRQSGAALVTWEVATVEDHAGFHVFRESAGSERVSITKNLLTQRRIYEVRDLNPSREEVKYWVQEISRTGGVAWHGPAVLAALTEPNAGLGLVSSSPNPFRVSISLSFNLLDAGDVRLTVLNLRGQVVQTLIQGFRSPGEHTAVWNGRNDRGARAAPGIYFVRLNWGGEMDAFKVTLLP